MIETGKSITTITQKKGLNSRTIVEAALKQESAMLDVRANNGELFLEKRNAELKKQSLLEFEIAHVSIDPAIRYAQQLGISEDDMWNKLENGQILNGIVTDAGYDIATVVISLQGSHLENNQIWIKADLMEEE